MLLMSCLFLVSCVDKELDNVQVSPAAITAGCEGGSYTFEVKANCSWDIQTKYYDNENGFVSLGMTSGTGNASVQFTVEKNNGDKIRRCSIDLYSRGAESPQSSLSVLQEGVSEKIANN